MRSVDWSARPTRWIPVGEMQMRGNADGWNIRLWPCPCGRGHRYSSAPKDDYLTTRTDARIRVRRWSEGCPNNPPGTADEERPQSAGVPHRPGGSGYSRVPLIGS